MDVSIHDPKRITCETMFVDFTCRDPGHVAVVEFECANGGKVSMTFFSHDELREHAAAMKLLADSLEEKQCATTA